MICLLSVNLTYLDVAQRKIYGKWKPYIIFYLSKKPTRFNKLKQLLNGINPNVLNQNLKELERDGIVIKSNGADGNNFIYSLSEPGMKIAQLLNKIVQVLDYLNGNTSPDLGSM